MTRNIGIKVKAPKGEEKNKELVDQRMKMAKDEINHWKDYKYIVVNKEVENCFEQITKIIKIERELRPENLDFNFYYKLVDLIKRRS